MKMLQTQVEQIVLSNMGFVVLLRGADDERTLPIFIGAAEAQAIALEVNNVKVPRPLTHDLLKNIMDCMECRLQRVDITKLEEGTFYADLVVHHDNVDFQIDTRPSDAIALALRFGCPIMVAPEVMEEAGQIIKTPSDNSAVDHSKPQATATDQRLHHIEILQQSLDSAVKEERYEDAARLRDKIEHLKDTHRHN